MQEVINYYLNTQNLLSYTLYILGAIILISVIAVIFKKLVLSKKNQPKEQNEQALKNDNNQASLEQTQDQAEKEPLVLSEEIQEIKASNEIARFIIKKNNLQYFATLIFNGEEIYSTEQYSSLSGVKSMIDSFVNCIIQNNFALTIDADKNYAFKLYFSQTKEPFISQPFSSLKECKAQIELLKNISKNYVIENDF